MRATVAVLCLLLAGCAQQAQQAGSSNPPLTAVDPAKAAAFKARYLAHAYDCPQYRETKFHATHEQALAFCDCPAEFFATHLTEHEMDVSDAMTYGPPPSAADANAMLATAARLQPALLATCAK